MAQDPLKSNKIFGALMLAGVIATGSAFVSNLLYSPKQAEKSGYIIEVPDSPSDATEVAEADPIVWPGVEALLSASIASNDMMMLQVGEKVFKKCASCHNVAEGAPHKVGPNLWSIVDRPKASADDYAYSAALKGMSDAAWTYENLNAFLVNPKAYAPGTKMAYRGMRKVNERAALLYYLGKQR